MSSAKKVAALAVSTAVLLGAAACSKGGSSAPAAEGEAVTLEAWTHAAGNKEELAGYKGSKGAVQFPLDQPLPMDLIIRIVQYRIAEMAIKAPKPKK